MGKILDGFAALLSRRRAPPGGNRRSFLVFDMGGRAFGIDVRNVQEIRRWERVQPVANAPEFVLGVLDVHGTKVPIIDIRPAGRVAATDAPMDAMILIKTEALLMGMVVDSVSDVIGLQASRILPPGEVLGGPGLPGIVGLTDIGSGAIILIDFDKLIAAIS